MQHQHHRKANNSQIDIIFEWLLLLLRRRPFVSHGGSGEGRMKERMESRLGCLFYSLNGFDKDQHAFVRIRGWPYIRLKAEKCSHKLFAKCIKLRDEAAGFAFLH